jgi:hypothetical protein
MLSPCRTARRCSATWLDDAALQVMGAAAVAEKRLKHRCDKDHCNGQNLKYSLPEQG